MLALPLAVLLAAAPPPVESWSARACPPRKEAPGSNVEMKFLEEQRAECLRKAMDKAVDRAVGVVKKTRPAAAPDWLALQADYQRWMQETCSAVEESNWVDLTSGERSMGTGYGFIESQCLQRHQAWRGYYAEACGRGECPSPAQVFVPLEAPARGARTAWRTYLTRVRRAAERAPERAADYLADARGTEVLYEAMATAVAQVRASAPGTGISDAWRTGVDADVRARRR